MFDVHGWEVNCSAVKWQQKRHIIPCCVYLFSMEAASSSIVTAVIIELLYIYICRPYHSLSFPWRIVEDAKEMIREWQKRYLQYYSVTGRRVLNRWRQTTLSTDYCSHTAYYLFFGRQIYDCFCYLPSILEPNRWIFARFGSRITYTKAKTMKNCSIWLNNRHSPCCRSPSPLPQPQL